MRNCEIRLMVLGMVGTNCYFLSNKETKEMILVDPADSPERIEAFARKQGYRPVAILLTHGHFDHILGVDKLRDAWRVPVYADEAEAEILGDCRKNLSAGLGGSVFETKADIYLKDGEEFTLAGFLIRMIHTPGHTAGGCCYYVESEKLLISGDTLFEGSCGRTDFPGGSMSTLVRSIQEKLFVLPEDVQVYPGHGEPTDIGREKKYNYVAGM
ncbi:MAG: MBL fold metallo-hydrolase [Lachnospiraceae bacterium]|nr:MBL fold metallo-hydrolase [Lachnospiraceae bacterium]